MAFLFFKEMPILESYIHTFVYGVMLQPKLLI